MLTEFDPDPTLANGYTKRKTKRSQDAYLRRLGRLGYDPDGFAKRTARGAVRTLQVMCRAPFQDPSVELTDAEAAEILLFSDDRVAETVAAQLVEIIDADPDHRPFSGLDKIEAAGWPLTEPVTDTDTSVAVTPRSAVAVTAVAVTARLCDTCLDPVPVTARSDARYCCNACRQAAYRERHR